MIEEEQNTSKTNKSKPCNLWLPPDGVIKIVGDHFDEKLIEKHGIKVWKCKGNCRKDCSFKYLCRNLTANKESKGKPLKDKARTALVHRHFKLVKEIAMGAQTSKKAKEADIVKKKNLLYISFKFQYSFQRFEWSCHSLSMVSCHSLSMTMDSWERRKRERKGWCCIFRDGAYDTCLMWYQQNCVLWTLFAFLFPLCFFYFFV